MRPLPILHSRRAVVDRHCVDCRADGRSIIPIERRHGEGRVRGQKTTALGFDVATSKYPPSKDDRGFSERRRVT